MEAGEEAAGHVERGVAVRLVALDAGAHAALLAYSAKVRARVKDMILFRPLKVMSCKFSDSAQYNNLLFHLVCYLSRKTAE